MKTEIFGNVMSLLKGKDGLEGATAIEAKNAFYGLFAGADKLVNNDERLLVLPATTLTEGCYQDMFNGCKGIEKAPELPAPTLVKDCYQEIFAGCSKLNYVKCLATDISAEGCTKNWLTNAGTEATGEKVLETLVPMPLNCDDGVPSGWTARTDGAKKAGSISYSDKDAQIKKTLADDDFTIELEKVGDALVSYSSSNTNVATVNAKTGEVSILAEGKTTITATVEDTEFYHYETTSASYELEVVEPESNGALEDYNRNDATEQ
jgi:hypothetical protein